MLRGERDQPRVAIDAYDEEPRQEFVKCVVVGDTCVGKTRLICSYVFNQPPIPRASLNTKAHVPTVFAIDHYMNDPVVHERARFSINGVVVQLRVWDTFGDHEKNRRFAYQNAHVVLICYSIGSQSSLRSVNSKWYAEIRKYCPRVPIILVGTHLDLRHTSPSEFRTNLRVTTLTDILYHRFKDVPQQASTEGIKLVSPDQGRQTAREIGAAMYMEVSIVSKHGVDLAFVNAACAALRARRLQRPLLLFHSHLKRIPPPVLQEPFLPPKKSAPEVSVLEKDEPVLYSRLFNDRVSTDVTFQVDSESVSAHCALLVAASEVFEHLFMQPILLSAVQCCESPVLDHKYAECTLLTEDAYVNGQLVSSIPRGFTSIDVVQRGNNSFHIFVKVKSISADNFRLIIEFMYGGRIAYVADPVSLLNAATYLQCDQVVRYAANILSSNPVHNDQLADELTVRVTAKLFEYFFCKSAYSDVAFTVDGKSIPAHKPVLVARCAMMEAMFRSGQFRESATHRIEFSEGSMDSVLAVLEYLYTNDCRSLAQCDLLATLQLANFLCLPRLVSMCETAMVSEIQAWQEEGCPEVYACVLASYNVAKMHNASQLAAWCLHFMATNYNQMCQSQGKQMKLLDDGAKRHLEENRYPPIWYLKEVDFYERTMHEMEKERGKKRKRKPRQRRLSACF